MNKQILGVVLLAGMQGAHAYSYYDTIRANEDRINYQKYYANAERRMYHNVATEYSKLSSDLKVYRNAHLEVLKRNRRMQYLQANLPAHRSYELVLDYGTTGIKWR